MTATATHPVIAPQAPANKVYQPALILLGCGIYRMHRREAEGYSISGLHLQPGPERYGIKQSASDLLNLVRAQPRMGSVHSIDETPVLSDTFVVQLLKTHQHRFSHVAVALPVAAEILMAICRRCCARARALFSRRHHLSDIAIITPADARCLMPAQMADRPTMGRRHQPASHLILS
jgi:hypothetical protein